MPYGCLLFAMAIFSCRALAERLFAACRRFILLIIAAMLRIAMPPLRHAYAVTPRLIDY